MVRTTTRCASGIRVTGGRAVDDCAPCAYHLESVRWRGEHAALSLSADDAYVMLLLCCAKCCRLCLCDRALADSAPSVLRARIVRLPVGSVMFIGAQFTVISVLKVRMKGSVAHRDIANSFRFGHGRYENSPRATSVQGRRERPLASSRGAERGTIMWHAQGDGKRVYTSSADQPFLGGASTEGDTCGDPR
jgi:hypothetical protein